MTITNFQNIYLLKDNDYTIYSRQGNYKYQDTTTLVDCSTGTGDYNPEGCSFVVNNPQNNYVRKFWEFSIFDY